MTGVHGGEKLLTPYQEAREKRRLRFHNLVWGHAPKDLKSLH
jgi:hypothetical protein